MRSRSARSFTTCCRTRRTRPRPPPSGTGRAGEVVIRTRLGDSGQRVRLTVQDSGAGFAENILKRAFEPYVTTKTKGTGLGLAVVKKIADEHGARIELSNRIVDGAVAGAQVSLSFALAGEPQGAAAHTEDSKSSPPERLQCSGGPASEPT